MILAPRTASVIVARAALGMVALGLTTFAVWSASGLWNRAGAAAQKPRVEEEEDTPKPKTSGKKPRVEEEEDTPKVPKRKVIRVEDEDDGKAKPAAPRGTAPAAGDLAQLAKQTRHVGARELLRELSVPHDVVAFKRSGSVTVGGKSGRPDEFVEPIPFYLGSDPSKFRKRLQLKPFTHDFKADKPYSPNLESIQYIQPYERVAQDKVRDFLKQAYDGEQRQSARYLSRYDMLVAAEQALTFVLRWHESARQTGQRTGEEWAAVEADLRKQLLDEVLLEQMKILVAAREWDPVLAMIRRLAVSYTSDADRARIGRPVADLLKSALNDPTASEESKQQARKRLHDLETEFPDNPAFRPLGEGLREQAQRLLNQAKELGKGKENLSRVLELIRQAEETWPQLPGLRAYKLELSSEHPVLRVGVRGRLPKYLSPAWACTDTERRVVEMLFEGLVKVSPDEEGIFRYRPGLAEYRPKVVTLGREFQLPRNASWSNGKRLDSGDIRETVRQLKVGVGTGLSCAWGELLDNPEVKGDAFRVILRLQKGYLDPLALMTFKILPAGQRVDGEKFAQNPVCSGPFVLDTSRQSDEKRRGCMFFVANPAYGSRPSKRDLPRIEEVRFYSYDDALKELRQGDLDLVLDLTAKEADEARQKAGALQAVVPLPSPSAPNRRIYFLAVNQGRVPDADLRRALAHAVNREKLLDDHFRGPLKRQVHKALNGPFPAGSWACNPALARRADGGVPELFDAERAAALAKKAAAKAVGETRLKLKYPEGDATLEAALKGLCEQVKQATGVVLDPVPCDPCRLREDVEVSQNYDLAYYHYDFPDETYWLWPLLGPPQRADADANFLKFNNDQVQQLLRDAMSYRDFGQVQKRLQTIHEYLNSAMPLIPLWQLDPLLAYHRDLQPVALDPVLVFTNVEEWRLQRSK